MSKFVRASHGVRWWLFGFLSVIGLLILGLCVGSREIPLGEVFPRIIPALFYAFGREPNSLEGVDEFTAIIANLRIPRTLLALLAGAALGTAGALIQGHTRNALADPGLLGINAGATLAVVSGVYFGFSGATDAAVLPALLGAGAATLVVFALSSSGATAASPLTLVLAGTAVTALLMAFVNALAITDSAALDTLRTWATGSVSGRSLAVAAAVTPSFILGTALALTQGQALNLLSMGESSARALGLNVVLRRVFGFAAIALLGGAAVSAAGPVAFIGLAAPPAARALWGPDYRVILPASLLIGALLALGADIFGRVAAPGELPMGIVLGLVGAPVFIFLVKRGKVLTP